MQVWSMIKGNPWLLAAASGVAVGGGMFLVRPAYFYNPDGSPRHFVFNEIFLAFVVFVVIVSYYMYNGKIAIPKIPYINKPAYVPLQQAPMMSKITSINDLLSPDQFE
jgi:hypothetical protein